jgi:hypothetical protein
MRGPVIGLVFWGILANVAAPAPGADISTEQVREAIQRAVTYMEREQRADGSWPDHPLYHGGVTALCTLALLSAGVEPEDPHIQKALRYLRNIKPAMTYTVSLQTMVFAKAEPDKDKMLINRNAKWLEQVQIQEGPRKGAWAYPEQGNGDNSNSQFAVLALYEAERAGVKVSGHTWRLAKAYWEDCQNLDGSWGYYKGFPGTGSMTCAGITSLIIASDRVQQADAKVEGEEIKCCQRAESSEDRLRRALEWLGSDRNFSVHHNPGTQMWVLYYLYGLERVGRLSARRFIGKHDWYREGTKALLELRGTIAGRDGWIGVGPGENDPRIGTSFALLFLSS